MNVPLLFLTSVPRSLGGLTKVVPLPAWKSRDAAVAVDPEVAALAVGEQLGGAADAPAPADRVGRAVDHHERRPAGRAVDDVAARQRRLDVDRPGIGAGRRHRGGDLDAEQVVVARAVAGGLEGHRRLGRAVPGELTWIWVGTGPLGSVW